MLQNKNTNNNTNNKDTNCRKSNFYLPAAPPPCHRIMTEPTLLPNNTSNTANVNSDKINLVFENLSVNRSVTNSVEIKGEIKNNTPLDLQEIKISANIIIKLELY